MEEYRSIILQTAHSLTRSLETALNEHEELHISHQKRSLEIILLKIELNKDAVAYRMQAMRDVEMHCIAAAAGQLQGEVKEMLEANLEQINVVKSDCKITYGYLEEAKGQVTNILQLMNQIDEAQQSIQATREKHLALMEELSQKDLGLDMDHEDAAE